MKSYVITIFFFLCWINVKSQKLDILKAPQSPAFQLLGVAPSTIERPSDPTDVILSVRQGTDDFTTFPSDYAMELAPVHLFRKKYINLVNDFLDNSSVSNNIKQSFLVSVGTTTQFSEVLERDISRIGFGFKLSFLRGEADRKAFYKSKQVLEDLGGITDKIIKLNKDKFDKDPEYTLIEKRIDTIKLKLNKSDEDELKDLPKLIHRNSSFINKEFVQVIELIKTLGGNNKINPTDADLKAAKEFLKFVEDTSGLWSNVNNEIPKDFVVDKDDLELIREKVEELSEKWKSQKNNIKGITFTNVEAINSSIKKIDGWLSELSYKLHDCIKKIENDAKLLKQLKIDKEERKVKLDSILNIENKELLDNYKSTLVALEVDRYGWKLDLAGGTVLDFPTQDFDLSYFSNTGLWLTTAYELKNGNSFLGMIRLLGNPNKYISHENNVLTTEGNLDLDIGVKYIYTSSKKISLQVEFLGRAILIDSPSKKFFDDSKVAITIDYKFKPNQIVSFTLGRDFFNNLDEEAGNLLAAINLAFGIGSKREIKEQ